MGERICELLAEKRRMEIKGNCGRLGQEGNGEINPTLSCGCWIVLCLKCSPVVRKFWPYGWIYNGCFVYFPPCQVSSHPTVNTHVRKKSKCHLWTRTHVREKKLSIFWDRVAGSNEHGLSLIPKQLSNGSFFFPPVLAPDSFNHKKFFQISGMTKKSGNQVKEIFQILDNDQSGYIEEEELKWVMGCCFLVPTAHSLLALPFLWSLIFECL